MSSFRSGSGLRHPPTAGEERFRGEIERSVEIDLPSDLGEIERTVDLLLACCEECGCDHRRSRLNFRVGLIEALSNAILYGNRHDPAKAVRVELRVRACSFEVRITDEGTGFDPHRIPDPTTDENRIRPGGRGLFLMRRLLDEVHFNERGNSVTLILHREPQNPGDGEGATA